ncbi:hypothetical protein G6F57_021561 [Rhizopus arrhizus]|nr:hypothetical protein G6F57_021561 [Rhizopus arrhizus]
MPSARASMMARRKPVPASNRLNNDPPPALVWTQVLKPAYPPPSVCTDPNACIELPSPQVASALGKLRAWSLPCATSMACSASMARWMSSTETTSRSVRYRSASVMRVSLFQGGFVRHRVDEGPDAGNLHFQRVAHSQKTRRLAAGPHAFRLPGGDDVAR